MKCCVVALPPPPPSTRYHDLFQPGLIVSNASILQMLDDIPLTDGWSPGRCVCVRACTCVGANIQLCFWIYYGVTFNGASARACTKTLTHSLTHSLHAAS